MENCDSDGNEALKLHFVSANDDLNLHNVAYLSERCSRNPWSHYEVSEFLKSPDNTMLAIKEPDGSLAGYIAYHHNPKEKKYEVIDLKIAPELAEASFKQSICRPKDDAGEGIDFASSKSKTVGFHLLIQLLALTAEGIKLDFSHLMHDPAIEKLVTSFNDQSAFIIQGDGPPPLRRINLPAINPSLSMAGVPLSTSHR